MHSCCLPRHLCQSDPRCDPGNMLCVRSAARVLPGSKPALRHARRSRCQPAVMKAVKQPHPGALQAAAKAIVMSLGILAGPASAQAMSQEAVDLFRLASVWQSVNNALILGFLTFYAASAWNNHKLYKARAEAEQLEAAFSADAGPEPATEQHDIAPLQQPTVTQQPAAPASPQLPAYAVVAEQPAAPAVVSPISVAASSSLPAAGSAAAELPEPAHPAYSKAAATEAAQPLPLFFPGAVVSDEAAVPLSSPPIVESSQQPAPAEEAISAQVLPAAVAEVAELPAHSKAPVETISHAQAQYEAKLTEVWAASAARQAQAEEVVRKGEQQLAAMRPVAAEPAAVDFRLKQPAVAASSTQQPSQPQGVVSKIVDSFVTAFKRLLGLLAALTRTDRPRAITV